MNVIASTPLFQNPAQYGIEEGAFVRLDEPISEKQAAYLDLVTGPDCAWVKQGLAVIEDQGNALLYVLPAEALKGDQSQLRHWLNVLACRGDARYLAVVHPGRLDFYALHLRTEREEPQPAYQNVLPGDLHSFLIGAWVKPESKDQQQKADKKWLETLLFDLLFGTAKDLLKKEKHLTHDQVLSLVGRALFVRFIADRGILKDQDIAAITQSAKTKNWTQLFSSPQTLAQTCAWLDKTFNGNLLPVLEGAEYPDASDYQAFFDRHASTHAILSDVLISADGGQMQLRWQDIQFQHVPADMLSQVYEQFAHKFLAVKAKKTSIYYTPRRIAQQLVNAAFEGVALEDKSRAHVLDPTAGAGVFLVLAYKRLVKERWATTGKRPDRKVLREEILYQQLCGMDINKQSLKFAALSLYLTALELDPDPQPLTDLKFEPLSERVLFDVDGAAYGELGSLHSHWSAGAFHQRFDMVVGNPPWTKPKDPDEDKPKDPGEGKAKTKIKNYTMVVRECAARAGLPQERVRTLKAEQGNPDPVFVWRSLSWAKPNGMLSFALHAQHMLFQKGASFELRRALLECVELVGLVNGSDLSETDIWPTQDAPFCLWIARNRAPENDSCFYYLNPYAETGLHERQQYRLDPNAAQVVSQSVVRSSPDAFKVLAKGSGLDLDVIGRIRLAAAGETVFSFWEKSGLLNRLGFRRNSEKSKAPKRDDGASELFGLPMLEKKYGTQNRLLNLLIDTETLPRFEYTPEQMREGCLRSLYRGPMVLMLETPDSKDQLGFHPTTGAGALLCLDDVAFNYSFYGYSCAGYAQPETLARYLQLLSVSSVLSYFTLMTSSKLGGGERPTLQKADIDQFPFIPLKNLPPALKDEIPKLSAQLLAGDKPWTSINEWARKIYKLSRPDMQVIEDTLRTAWPRNTFAEERPESFDPFVETVQRVMQPFADFAEVPLHVQLCNTDESSGWAFIKVSFGKDAQPSNAPPDNWQEWLAVANQFWASLVKVDPGKSQRVIYIGQLARNRYWTQTRARMLAMDLLNNDLEQHGKFAHYAQSKGGH